MHKFMSHVCSTDGEPVKGLRMRHTTGTHAQASDVERGEGCVCHRHFLSEHLRSPCPMLKRATRMRRGKKTSRGNVCPRTKDEWLA